MEMTQIHTAPVPTPIRVPLIGSANKRKLPIFHLVVAVFATLVFLLFAIVVALHGYIAWALARPPAMPLISTPLQAIGLAYQDVQFPSANGKTVLSGWYIPAERPSDNTIVFSHGYGGNREEIWVPIYDLALASHLEGYNVLMFDYGFVQPDQIVTGGVQEKEELLGAVHFAKQQGALNTVVWGFSMGAGTALQAALQTSDIDAMILDSTFILTPDTLYHNMKQFIDVPRNPSVPLIRAFFPLLNGSSLQQIPYQTVSRTDFQIPIFFIHGQQDAKAPYQIAQELHRNQDHNPLSELWVSPRDIHELIYRSHKQEYMRRTFAFLGDAMEAAQSSTYAMSVSME
jgi:uncharacterized protein